MSEWERVQKEIDENIDGMFQEELNKKIDDYIRETGEKIEKALLSQFKKIGVEVNKLQKGDVVKKIDVINDIDRYYYKDIILILEVNRHFDNEKLQFISEIKIPN